MRPENKPMPKQPTLETERLILRPFAPSDAPDVQRLAGERAIADTTLGIPHPYADGIAEHWIASHQAIFDEGAGVQLAITRKPDATLVGAIGLVGIVKGHQAEMGYWIGVPYWSQGFCTEAARAVVAFAFSELGLVRVYAAYLLRNPASGRVMQKIGMRYEGCRRGHVKKWDVLEDLALYGMLKDDWLNAEGYSNPTAAVKIA